MVFYGGHFGRSIPYRTAVVGDITYIGIDHGETPYVSEGVGKVQVTVSVAVVGTVDEKVGPALEEPDRIKGLGPGRVLFREQRADK